MSKYPNPCNTCDRTACNHLKCEPWLKRFRTIWKQFNDYPARAYTSEQTENSTVFRYEHPGIIRRYLENGPCAECQRAKVCEVPCSAYWRWWDARMEWLGRRLKL